MRRNVAIVDLRGLPTGPAYTDLDRPPLRQRLLARALADDPTWDEVVVVAEAGSTNDVAAVAARGGQHEGLVVVAEHQTAGRGRHGRAWVAPPRSGLAVSVLLRPPVDRRGDWGWLPLVAGLACVAAVRDVAGIEAGLKWPNDVLVNGTRKVAGLLAEVHGDAVVVGLGLNVSTTRAELPTDTATSLALETGGVVDRQPVLLAYLRRLGARYRDLVAGAPPHDDYRSACTTLGADVRVTLPGDRVVEGRAVDVDADGRLVVDRTDGATEVVGAGDVVHVRPA
jgi:BirA family transcriptional regulator, biotin operon repressor / biotin---[acetyl-CoA-carboxylase] ligase